MRMPWLIQARLTLELTMRRQIDRRKEQTRLLRTYVPFKAPSVAQSTDMGSLLCFARKCQELAERLTSLRDEVRSGGLDPAGEGKSAAAAGKTEMMDGS